MARRVLSPRLVPGAVCAALELALGFDLTACHRSEPRPTQRAAASASASLLYTESARAAHLRTELERARARWSGKPKLDECSAAVHEKEDSNLCQAANAALTALEQDPDAPLSVELPALESSALSLARLSKRLRYLALSELSQKHRGGDAGAPLGPAPSGHGALRDPKEPQRAREPRDTLELSDGPITQLLTATARLERDALRNLGAYLEYAELPTRRAALASVKRLHEQHSPWPLLGRLLREAALLESDPDSKAELSRLVASEAPSAPHSDHSADSK